MMSIYYRDMTIDDYNEVSYLWKSVGGLALSAADSREEIDRFLAHNPGLSQVAVAEGAVVGAVLCGHDGRRGSVYHLAVAPAFRGLGLGRGLVERCLARLGELGIAKCHAFVLHDNAAGLQFWRRLGWNARHDLVHLQQSTPQLTMLSLTA
jgi:ribosomal protein S18 acetylase RimI-like enzyme